MKIKEILSKKLLGLIAGLIVIVGVVIFLFAYTYTVSGKITDITNQQAVRGVKISVASHEQTTDSQGNYKISGIKIYQKKNLAIDPPSQFIKPTEIRLNYKGRNIQKNFTLEPTLTETVNRILIGEQNGQYDYLWDLMYPDDQKYWGNQNNYTNLFAQVRKIQTNMSISEKSASIGQNIRQLDTWKSPITGKEYKNITEVPINYIMVESGKEQPQNNLTHYKEINGYYHYFTSTNKDDTQKSIDAYNALTNN